MLKKNDLEIISIFLVLLFLIFNLPRIVINIIDIWHHHIQLEGQDFFVKMFWGGRRGGTKQH